MTHSQDLPEKSRATHRAPWFVGVTLEVGGDLDVAGSHGEVDVMFGASPLLLFSFLQEKHPALRGTADLRASFGELTRLGRQQQAHPQISRYFRQMTCEEPPNGFLQAMNPQLVRFLSNPASRINQHNNRPARLCSRSREVTDIPFRVTLRQTLFFE